MVDTETLLEIADIGNLMLAPLSLFPLILSFRYYLKTKITDYFLLTIYFFAYSILNIVELWYFGFTVRTYTHIGIFGKYELWDQFYGNFFNYWYNGLDSLSLFLVAVRARYGTEFAKIPKKVIVLGSIPIIFTLVGWIDQRETRLHEDLFTTSISTIGVIIGRLIFHSFIVYVFLSTEYEKSPRTIRSRYLWIFSSIFQIISYSEFVVMDFILAEPIGNSEFKILVFFIFIDMGFFLILLNHIFYPEAVLFTHEQINRAFSLYGKIELTGNRVKDYGIARIINYLDTLPKELKEQLSIQSSS